MAKDNNIRPSYFDEKINLINRLESIFEMFVLGCIYYLVWKYLYRANGFFPYYGYGKVVLVGVYMLLIGVIYTLCDSFKFGHLKLSDIVVSQSISILIVNFITYFQLCLIANQMINPVGMFLLTGIDIIVGFALVYIYTAVYHISYVPRNMIMIYGSENAVNLKFKMDTRSDRYKVSKVISCNNDIELIKAEISKHDAVIINDVNDELSNDILKYCYANSIRTYIVPKISDLIIRGADDINLFDTPLFLVRGSGLALSQRIIKRVFDIVLAMIALIPALPIMLIVSLAIKIEDGGPVFYKQKRITINGAEFEILKFRSMITDAEKGGYKLSMRASNQDNRITRVGRIIRPCRIDELPQIFNILKGDMSIVGPRPERIENMQEYIKEIPEFAYRTKIKGGLTGYAQIYGKYNTTAYDKVKLDLMYIENYSLFLDIKLIFMTLQVLFKPESTEGFDNEKHMEKMRNELLMGNHISTENCDEDN